MSVVSQTSLSDGRALRQHKNTNQKCNFKYLMNSKTNRSTRNFQKEKQNEIESVLMGKAHKFALKTERVKTCYNESQKVVGSFNEIIDNSYHTRYCDNQEDIKNTRRYKSDETMGNQSESEQRRDTASMTEECYEVKQLHIKMDLLKKQRDDMWNSIADIVKQNQDLKQKMKTISIQKANKSVQIQTQVFCEVYQVQTEFQEKDWQSITIQRDNISRQLSEAKQFCNNFIDKEKKGDYTIKSIISEAISQSIIKLTTEFQHEKNIFQEMHHSQVTKQSKVIESFKQKALKMEEQLKQQKKTRMNMQKIYSKEIQEIRNIMNTKESELNHQIHKMAEQLQERINTDEQQNSNFMQYIQSLNRSWLEKQKIYSTLLSQSHKTINSLMNQMRQFEGLANSNYTKYLHSERSHAHRQ